MVGGRRGGVIGMQTHPESRRQEPRADKAHEIHYPDGCAGRSMDVPGGLRHRCGPAPLIRPRRLLSCAGMIRIRFEGSFSARRVTASWNRAVPVGRQALSVGFGHAYRTPPAACPRKLTKDCRDFNPIEPRVLRGPALHLTFGFGLPIPKSVSRESARVDGVGPGNGRQDLSTPHRGAFAHERSRYRGYRE